MLTSKHLRAFMQENGIQGEILHLEASVSTVNQAAEAVGAQPDQIVKSLLFSVADQQVLVIACGPQRISSKTIANHYGITSKQVKLASPPVVLATTGYEVGTVPPFGHHQPIATLVDRRVLEQETVYAGGGGHRVLLRFSPGEILRVTTAETIDLHGQA